MPLKLKQPSRIFTCSLTDFFLPEIDEFRDEAWDIIRKCPQHTFQILTKRPERIGECLPEFWNEIRERVWLGTSVGSEAGLHRIESLVNQLTVAKVLFISMEPLHGPINLHNSNYAHLIDWVIVGGESGNDNGQYRYRPCDQLWIEAIVQYCNLFEIPVFVKQLGTHLAKEMKLSDRHGGDIEEFPNHLKIREFPNQQS